MPARDGAHLLNPHPQVVQEPDVEQVIAALTDPHRRGLAFVAGTAHNAKVSPWRDVVEELLDDTEGLANAWVLTAEATERFNFLVQRSHEVLAGRVRTYVPAVVLGKAPLGNPLDAERHRYLTRRSIEREPSQALRRVFGERARRQMISTPLPDLLRDLDHILRRELDTALLDQLSPAPLPLRPAHRPAPVQPTPAQRPAPIQPEPVEQQTPSPIVVPEPGAVTTSRSGVETYLTALLRDLIGTDELTLDNLAQLGTMAKASQRAEDTRDRISARLEQLRDNVDEAQFERDLAREELATEQHERAAAEEDRADAERRLRHVQKELASLGRVNAWSDAGPDESDKRPDTFIDLLGRLTELEHVVFTGDAEVTLGLDRHGNAAWAGKVWDALMALDDYARLSLTEAYTRDVTGYLADTPAGCRGFSANRHATTESEGVHKNPKFRKPRELPVPREVDASERVLMGAHFKIAQSSMISPRVHYLDATARTRKIYVGHIGPHLSTSRS